ncbi:peptidylprolyl isomerase [Candidatus Acidulodesulfobacterium sp. H_13]|uniref:peptidylprolyl isomerase n=1 Tax=Candidatus Acidulodesulfobacterium sp. H_13 TaxID=3395470 RepID=UPI003AF7D1EC
MKKIKIFMFCVILAFFTLSIFFTGVKDANAVIVDKIIVVVNKTPITLYDFAKFDVIAFKNYENMQNDASRGIFTQSDVAIMSRTKDVINVLVGKVLIKQEEKKAGIHIAPEQLNTYIKSVAASNNFTEKQFFIFLKKKGINKDAYIKQVRNHFLELELLRKIYGNKIVISNKQMLDYYQKNIEEFRGEPMVNLKLIFLSVPPDAGKKLRASIYGKISKIRSMAVVGNKSFSELAKKYSEDPSEKNGGSIGYVYKDKLSPDFSKAAFKLHVGEVSGVIKTPFGYAILKSVGKKSGSFKTFKQVKAKIFSILEKYKTNEYLAKLLKKVRKNSYVKMLIAA